MCQGGGGVSPHPSSPLTRVRFWGANRPAQYFYYFSRGWGVKCRHAPLRGAGRTGGPFLPLRLCRPLLRGGYSRRAWFCRLPAKQPNYSWRPQLWGLGQGGGGRAPRRGTPSPRWLYSASEWGRGALRPGRLRPSIWRVRYSEPGTAAACGASSPATPAHSCRPGRPSTSCDQ